MILTHLILFDFFIGASGVITVSPPDGPWFVVAVDAFSAGAIASDSFSAGALAVDG